MNRSLQFRASAWTALLVVPVLVTACSTVPASTSAPTLTAHRHSASPANYSVPGDMSPPYVPDDPAVRNLDPDLRAAFQDAARGARADGIELRITSGWRSRAHQQRLLDEAVKKYGSLAEALRWVSAPDKSAHVSGDAVDIGPSEADSWLSQHGSAYGLCQIFANEVWHYELATRPGGTCPPLLPDSTYR